MSRKRLLCLIVSVFVLMSVLPSGAYASEVVSYRDYPDMAVYLVETNTGEIIAAQREHERMYPGSLTKVMSAMVVLDLAGEDEKVTVTQEVIDMMAFDSSTADLVDGEVMSVRELLYASLIPSGNDAAIVLAVYCGAKIAPEGSGIQDCYRLFVERMNQKRAELGMSESNFANPDGIDDWNNYSTAYDIALMGQAARKYDLIKRICAMDDVTITTTADSHEWHTTNMLHTEYYYEWGTAYENPYYLECVDGMKTGYTDMGNRCLLLSFSHEGMDVVGAILNVPVDDWNEMWERSYRLVSEINAAKCIQSPVDDMNRSCTLEIKNHGLFGEKTVTLWAEEDLTFIADRERCAEGLEPVIEYDPELIEIKKNGRLRLTRALVKGDAPAWMVFRSVSDGGEVARVRMIAVDGYRIFAWPDWIFIILCVLFVLAMWAGIRRSYGKKKRRHAR